MPEREDEFYIGYLDQAPPKTARHLRFTVIAVLVVAAVLAAFLTAAQKPFAPSVHEFGIVKRFSGKVRVAPYPHLEVWQEDGGVERYYLVGPFKFGADVARWADRRVSLDGTLIQYGEDTMVEVVPDSFQELADVTAGVPSTTPVESLGVYTLRGEIVDSKCHLGVMKPGEGKVHRACAVRCLSGGIPPLFLVYNSLVYNSLVYDSLVYDSLVRDGEGPAARLLLADEDGRALGKEVLRYVAEPLEITGEVSRIGDLLILAADVDTYRRLP